MCNRYPQPSISCLISECIDFWCDGSLTRCKKWGESMCLLMCMFVLMCERGTSDTLRNVFGFGFCTDAAGVCRGKVLRHVSPQQPGEKHRWYAPDPSPFLCEYEHRASDHNSQIKHSSSEGISVKMTMTFRHVQDDGVRAARYDHNDGKHKDTMDRWLRCWRHFCKTVSCIMQNLCNRS